VVKKSERFCNVDRKSFFKTFVAKAIRPATLKRHNSVMIAWLTIMLLSVQVKYFSLSCRTLKLSDQAELIYDTMVL
jgi:hypothetical protein